MISIMQCILIILVYNLAQEIKDIHFTCIAGFEPKQQLAQLY